ncbi:MAG: WD40 repeat domain-containing protein [Prosthecobacter sp.]|uniref:WD40 repeat domain-containing protein n=1 Tax=Prosthecobacter sp. TaxID=1965333 RepID=UPI0025CEFDD3|nr:WD40 repeat domain-containing protein [Prosthecobacter sp.]MCF7785088.1 WD40 repeat domain-containing protein [Prosthecobacter sp.]
MKTLIALMLLGTLVCANDSVPVTALTFTPDGRQIVYNTAAGLVIRDLDEKASPKTLLELKWPKITAAVFDPSGRWLAVAGGVPGENGDILLLEWSSRREVARWETAGDLVAAIAWTHTSSRLAAACHDQSVCVFSTAGGTLAPPVIFSGHTRPVFAVAFSPDDKRLVSAGADRTLKVWDSQSGKLERTLAHHTDIVQCLAFRPLHAGNDCASAGADQTVRIWQPAIGRMVRIVRHHDGAVFALAWHPQGDRLFSAGQEGIVRVIDAHSDQVLNSWQASTEWIYRLAVSPDGSRLVTGDWQGQAKVWQLAELPDAKP